jgi:hypothetical protein
LAVLFDRKSVADNLAAFNGLDKRLNPLMEYREFDYWIYQDYRNPIQLVAHLKDAAKTMDSRNPIHLALFLDLAWLYLVTLIRATEHLRGAFLGDPDRGLQEYLFGGAINLREKEDTAALLRTVAPPGAPELDHLPPYYGSLRELVTRLLRRPSEIQTALRYAEAASGLMAAKQRVTLGDAFGGRFDPVAAKLVADVCGFLVAAAQLDPGFRSQARAYLLAEPVSGTHAGGMNLGNKSRLDIQPQQSSSSEMRHPTQVQNAPEDRSVQGPHDAPAPQVSPPRLVSSGNRESPSSQQQIELDLDISDQ